MEILSCCLNDFYKKPHVSKLRGKIENQGPFPGFFKLIKAGIWWRRLILFRNFDYLGKRGIYVCCQFSPIEI